jgi:hypothetical protein
MPASSGHPAATAKPQQTEFYGDGVNRTRVRFPPSRDGGALARSPLSQVPCLLRSVTVMTTVADRYASERPHASKPRVVRGLKLAHKAVRDRVHCQLLPGGRAPDRDGTQG